MPSKIFLILSLRPKGTCRRTRDRSAAGAFTGQRSKIHKLESGMMTEGASLFSLVGLRASICLYCAAFERA